MQAASTRVAYVAYTFPVLTQTFTTREVRALRECGLDVVAYAVRRDPQAHLDSEARDEAERARYLPPPLSARALGDVLGWMLRRPLRTIGTLLRCLGGGYRHDGWRYRLRAPLHFVSGVSLAATLRRDGGAARVHAQFLDAGSTVAFTAARLLDVPFSFTNHTAFNPFLLSPKAAVADLALSISEFDRELLRMAVPGMSARQEISRVGIRVEDWTGLDLRPEPGRVLSVAALREKKGHADLIRAAGQLRAAGTEIHVVLVGDGAERAALERLTSEVGASVEFVGAAGPERVREELCRATAFCLPCRIAADGDLDGIPVALMESMAAGVPVISTRLSGVPELIEDEVSGLLVEPGDSAGLASALERVLGDLELRERLAQAARPRVARLHGFDVTAPRLAQLLATPPGNLRDGATSGIT